MDQVVQNTKSFRVRLRQIKLQEYSRDGARQMAHDGLPELRVPSSWQKFNTEVGLHPTQKPVPLFEYLIRTYTTHGEIVLDNCIGSGTTAMACINANRRHIGFETDTGYFKAAETRIQRHVQPLVEVSTQKTAGLDVLFDAAEDVA